TDHHLLVSSSPTRSPGSKPTSSGRFPQGSFWRSWAVGNRHHREIKQPSFVVSCTENGRFLTFNLSICADRTPHEQRLLARLQANIGRRAAETPTKRSQDRRCRSSALLRVFIQLSLHEPRVERGMTTKIVKPTTAVMRSPLMSGCVKG